MKKVFNLASDSISQFSDDLSSIYCVAYCYCQDNNMMSKLFYNLHNKTLESLYTQLPIVMGKNTVSCGDFACKL